MATICSIGTSVPEHVLKQHEAKELIASLITDERMNRFLPVFDQANIEKRHFVVHPSYFEENRSFQERNQLYEKHGVDLATEAVTKCLGNQDSLKPSDIDAIISVNSTGILTPSLDAELINRLDLNEDSVRIPLFGLGCAGGASGLARAYDYLKAHPTHSVLVIATELASIAFHPNDLTPKDIVGAAIFSDGAGAVLLLGEEHESNHGKYSFQLKSTSSRMKKNTMDLMGWEIRDDGFFVIFSREIPNLVRFFWKEHMTDFLSGNGAKLEDIHQFITHPGGKKILENMNQLLYPNQHVALSEQVLNDYGNMSSATVLFVLEEFLKMSKDEQSGKHLISALGPGFSSELLLLEQRK